VLKCLQSIIGPFQTRSAFCEFSEVVESFTSKVEDGLTSYFILDVLEAKIFQKNFMEGHNVWGNVCYSSSIRRNIVALLATTNFQDLVAKVKNLVALAPVLGAIWCPGIGNLGRVKLWLQIQNGRFCCPLLCTSVEAFSQHKFFPGTT